MVRRHLFAESTTITITHLGTEEFCVGNMTNVFNIGSQQQEARHTGQEKLETLATPKQHEGGFHTFHFNK